MLSEFTVGKEEHAQVYSWICKYIYLFFDVSEKIHLIRVNTFELTFIFRPKWHHHRAWTVQEQAEKKSNIISKIV